MIRKTIVLNVCFAALFVASFTSLTVRAALVTFFSDKKNSQIEVAPSVRDFVRNEFAKCGIPNAQFTKVYLGDENCKGDIGVSKVGEVMINRNIAQRLNKALCVDNTVINQQAKGLYKDADIALYSMVMKHEAGHVKHSDCFRLERLRKGMVMFWYLPVVVIGGLLAHGTKKNEHVMLFCGAMLSAFCGMIAVEHKYSRCYESEADEYACKNAENRNQLQQLYNIFDQGELDFKKAYWEKYPLLKRFSEENQSRLLRLAHYLFDDRKHPYYSDRAAMVKKYIQKWDDKNQKIADYLFAGARHPYDFDRFSMAKKI
jgi:hypothetical protein